MSALIHPKTADYDADFYAWTQEQAERLRVLQMTGHLPAELDIANIAEEIESLGRSDLHAVESQIVNVFSHLIKAISVPSSPSNSHWRTEGIVFVRDMQRRYSRSMRHRMEIQTAWSTAREAAEASLKAHGQNLLAGIPKRCPFSVVEVLESGLRFEELEITLVERLETAR